MRLREKMALKNIEVSLIIKEEAPLDEELVESMNEVQQLEPIKVTPMLVEGVEMYRVIDGRRRYLSALELEQKTITAIIIQDVDEEELHTRALVANSGKTNAMDECIHMLKLQEMGWSREKIAQACRYEKTKVDWILHLQKLIPEMQALVRKGPRKRPDGSNPGLPYTTGYEISRLPHDQQMILYKQWEEGQKLTQPYVLKFIRDYQASLIVLTDDDQQKQQEKKLPNLFVEGEQLQAVLEGGALNIEWNGVRLTITQGDLL